MIEKEHCFLQNTLIGDPSGLFHLLHWMVLILIVHENQADPLIYHLTETLKSINGNFYKLKWTMMTKRLIVSKFEICPQTFHVSNISRFMLTLVINWLGYKIVYLL